MPDVPRQVKIILLRLSRCILVCALAAGCDTAQREPKSQRGPVAFPDETAIPRLMVCGSLLDRLPRFDPTPALDRFLYGPDDSGRSVLRNPQGMALLGGTLLVCDQGYPDIVAIDLASGRSTFWSDADHRPRCPVAIAVEGEQRVFVADTTARSVLVYESRGRFIEELTPSPQPDQAFRPCAVLVHEGVLYVGNVGEHRVDRYDLAGQNWLAPMDPPSEGGLGAPTGLAATPNGVLLIADALRGRVFRSTREGQWLPPIGRPGRGLGQFVRPKGICCTPSGLIVVADTGRQSLLVFTEDGRYLTEIHERPGRWNGLTLPSGIITMTPERLWPEGTDPSRDDTALVESYLVVSDALQAPSLLLLGVITRPMESQADVSGAR